MPVHHFAGRDGCFFLHRDRRRSYFLSLITGLDHDGLIGVVNCIIHHVEGERRRRRGHIGRHDDLQRPFGGVIVAGGRSLQGKVYDRRRGHGIVDQRGRYRNLPARSSFGHGIGLHLQRDFRDVIQRPAVETGAGDYGPGG